MTFTEQLQKLGANLLALGVRRLTALGIVGATVFAGIAAGSYYLSKPDYETLYVGLNPQEVSRIGSVLRDSGIAFDVNAESTKIVVRRGQTANARMILAEKGLPSNPSAGYELFDKLGSMSLTSFMQNVTRVRALEGEIARTVQVMKGVKAARVHIVMPDPGSFRRQQQAPSASVVVRTDGPSFGSAEAIRRLVAAAVPGMQPDQVSVLSTDGTILSSGGDGVSAIPAKILDIEKQVGRDVADSIRRTLTPFLGLSNFELSVIARLNFDKRQTNETTFDPESKVERSVRSVKESSNSQNANNKWTVSVEQNVPNEAQGSQPGAQSRRTSDRKEDLVNFEVNSKVTSTVSDGYRIDNLAVAVVVNRKRLASGAQDASNEAITAQVKEIEKLVTSAAALDPRRGDKITVAAVDFFGTADTLDPVPTPDIWDMLIPQGGSIINALALLIITVLLIWFGLKPAMQLILQNREHLASPPALTAQDTVRVLEGKTVSPAQLEEDEPKTIPLGNARKEPSPQHKLEEVVSQNEEQAAAVLKEWIRGA